MLNYKHLYYFREVARSGSIARASERLHITPQTISMQLSTLEEELGTQLFERIGRNLELSEAGEVALSYADDIFALGTELQEILQHYPEGKTHFFRVGVSDVVPKIIVYKLLEPAMKLDKPVRIVCIEGKLPDLLAELAVQRMQLVIADSPMPPKMNVKGFNHELGASSVGFYVHKNLYPRFTELPFPACLDGAPLLMPNEGAAVRSKLVHWFHELQIKPRIIGEFDDSALMKAFAMAERGIFIAPSVLRDSLEQEGMAFLGATDKILEKFYAISIERRITHPAVKAITEQAQGWLHYLEKKPKSIMV